MPVQTSRQMVPVAIALVSGLVAAGLFYQETRSPVEARVAHSHLLVTAKGLIPESRAIVAQDLQVITLASPIKGTFQDAISLVGRVPLVPIPAGEPILGSHLAPAGVQDGLWYQVKPGHRAVTVAVNEVVGVGGFLKTGLNVDVIGVTQTDLNWSASTIAEDITVLAIAQNDRRKKDDPKAQVATSATLMVTPRQAEAISLASERGRIRLVLRAVGDHTRRIQKAVAAAQPPKALVAQAKQAPNTTTPALTIQVIRGSEVNYVTP